MFEQFKALLVDELQVEEDKIAVNKTVVVNANTVIWMAGYEKEMRKALSSNPGIFRRVSTILLPDPGLDNLWRRFWDNVQDVKEADKMIIQRKKPEIMKYFRWGTTMEHAEFFGNYSGARKLAENMVAIGKACGRNVRAVLSNMDVPLGMAIGNALEVREAAEILQGRGCEDLRGVCMTLAANMVELCNGWDEDYAREQVHEAVASGKAFEQMKRWISAQGGDASVLDDFSKLPQASIVHEILAPHDGWISRMDTQKVGEASSILGAGRMTKEDTIDFAAGIVLSKKTGDFAKKGDVLARLYTNKPETVPESEAIFLRALCWSEEQPAPETLIFDIIR